MAVATKLRISGLMNFYDVGGVFRKYGKPGFAVLHQVPPDLKVVHRLDQS